MRSVIIVFTFIISNYTLSQNLSFSHLGLEEGLPQETVLCLTQDDDGFLWAGTSDGVVRYDGQDFYVPEADDTSNLDIAGYRIGAILAKDDIVYVGTGQNGLLAYNRISQTTNQIFKSDADCTQLLEKDDAVIASFFNNGVILIQNNEVKPVSFDKKPQKIIGLANDDNVIYVASRTGGVYRFDYRNINKSTTVPIENLFKIDQVITSICVINKNLFVTTEQGFFVYNTFLKTVEKIQSNDPQNSLNRTINAVKLIDDTWYIATNYGLFLGDIIDTTFYVKKRYVATNFTDENTISFDNVNTLCELQDNTLAIGTFHLELANLSQNDVFQLPTSNFNVNDPSTFAVIETGNFLFNATSSGLVIAESKNRNNFKLFPNYRVRGFTVDDNNMLWMVTGLGAFLVDLDTFSLENPKFITIPVDKNNPNALHSGNLRSIYKDHNGTIWMPTYNDGFIKFTGDISKNEFSFKRYSTDRLPSIYTIAMVQDHLGDYWMTTQKALCRLRFKNDSLIEVKNYDEASGLSTKGVLSAFIDKNTTLWIASRKGLNKYNRTTDRFTSYGKREGLSNTFIYNIEEDHLDNLWLSTNGGLFRFNKTTEEFTNYNTKDGVQSTEFNLGAVYKNPDNGHLYFGGINGLNIFDPDRIKELDKEGSLSLTQFKVKDQNITANASDIIAQSISKTETLDIAYNNFPLELSFSALDYRPNSNIKYVYKLLPDDKNWNDLDYKNQLQFLSLSPKNYTLQIQGKSRNDLWQKPPLELQINVTPPWYRSNLAYLIYLLVFLSIVFAFYRISLQRQIAGQESKRLQDLDDLKSRFITNITHEFRTPLTIILGYLGNLKELFSAKDEVSISLDTIEQNSNNLLDLVNQMLDLAKLEKGQLNINFIQNDIVTYILHIVNSFESIANDKGISLKFNATPDEIIMDFDAEKIRQILTNLISNAIKFSPQQSELSIGIEKINNSNLQIKVADQGYGISEKELPFIFDRFYQVENAEHKVSQGTGVGLALTKELVELFKGTISVASTVNKGTRFTINLPITNNAPSQNIEHIERQMTVGTIVPQLDDVIADEDANAVLIVEDNADMARYIASCLKPDYKITFAKDGKEGLELAIKQIPDIIISDVMMPVMDGFELTQQLQANTNTNHIPIILLTSKALQNDKLEGLKSGADAYLTKPFQKQELKIRLQNLIEKRAALQEFYSQKKIVTLNTTEAKQDKTLAFLDTVTQKILEHIEDAAFNTSKLAEAVYLSESQLYRKLKALTNKSTAIYIRSVRLEKAKEILEQNDVTVSEVAYLTGFNDPKWFSKTFKEEFGINPSEV